MHLLIYDVDILTQDVDYITQVIVIAKDRARANELLEDDDRVDSSRLRIMIPISKYWKERVIFRTDE